MTRAPAGPTAAGFLLVTVLAGCWAGPAPRPDASAGPTGGSIPADPGAGTPATGPPAYRSDPPPGRPAALADDVPSGPAGWSAQLWFGGVLIGRDGTRLVVAYPAIEVSSDGDRVVAHAKLAMFRCLRRKAVTSPDFVGCTGRRVEYGDLTRPELQVTRTPVGAFTLAGSFPTYVYGGAVDRGPGLPLRWTGRTVPLRVRCVPGRPEPGRYGRFAGTASVAVGQATGSGVARLDLGYPNRGGR